MATRKTKCLVGTDAGSYTFDASAKQITFSAGLISSVEQVLLITNVTDNIRIYDFNDPAKGATLSGLVLTLDHDTTSMSDSDKLQIWIVAEPTLGLKIELPADAAKESKQDTANTSLATIAGKDFATQATLALLLAKVIAAPSTEAKQDAIIVLLTTLAGKDFATQATLAALLTELDKKADLSETQPVSAASLPLPANAAKETGGNLDAIAAKDFATQTTLAAILAELRDDTFVTSTLWEDNSAATSVFYREERIKSQDDGTITTVYTRLSDNTIVGSLPAGVILVAANSERDIQFHRWKATANGTGYSTGDWLANTVVFNTSGAGTIVSSTWYNLTTSSAISAPASGDIADPQAGNASETTLAAINAKIPAAPSTEGKQDTGNASLATIAAKDFATQTTLLALLNKVISAPSTEAKQDAIITLLTTLTGKDFATQTTLAAILTKMIAAPATEAKQDAANTSLASIATNVAKESSLKELNFAIEHMVEILKAPPYMTNIGEIRVQAGATPGSVAVSGSLTTLTNLFTLGAGMMDQTFTYFNQLIHTQETILQGILIDD